MSYFTKKFGVTGDKIMRPVMPLPISSSALSTKVIVEPATNYQVIRIQNSIFAIIDQLVTVSGRIIHFEGICRLFTGTKNIAFRTNRINEQIRIKINDPTAEPITIYGGETFVFPAPIQEIYFSWENAVTFNAEYYAVFFVYNDISTIISRAISPFFKVNAESKEQEALAEIDNATGRLLVNSLQSGSVTIANTTKTIVRTAVSLTADGNLVAAAGGSNKIKVLGMFLFAGLADNIIIKNGSAGAALIGQCNFGDNQGYVLPIQPVDFNGNFIHWIETSANTALFADVSTAAQVGGIVVHINEP